MSRGRGGSEVEQERVRSEIGSTRSSAKSGTGPKNFEKKGFGGGSMQKNPKGKPKNDF